MSNITVKLHVNADYDPQIGLRGFVGLLAGDGNIQYVVDEYTQITLPNYNTVYKSDYILVGWCEKPESERVNGVDPIYTYYYEPVDDCDLYPVWVSSNISIKQATITPVMSTVTTVTAIGNLSEEERPYAQAAIDAFNTMVDDQVTASAADIIRDEVRPIAEDVAREVVQEEFDAWSGGIDSRLTNAEGRLDVLEEENGEQNDKISTLSLQYTGQEARLNGIDSEIEEVNTTVNGHGVQIGYLLGSIAELDQASRQNAEGITQLTVTVSSNTNDIIGLNGSVGNLTERIGSLETSRDAQEQRIDDVVGSVTNESARINNIISSIAGISADMTSESARIDNVISSISDVSSDITTLNSKVTDITAQISTQAIQEKAGATASDIAYKMANTVTFRLDGNQKTEAACTLSSQYDYKRIKTLADYKNSPDYNFGTNVVWYNNGVIMSDLDPITSGSVLIGIEPTGAPEIYALPVVSIDEKVFDVETREEKAATNFGVTSINFEEDVAFDSTKSYNPCVTVSTLMQVVILKAEAMPGCKFGGWYVISTQEDETINPEYIVSKDPEFMFEATEDTKYAALFEGEPEEDFYTPVRYIPSESPWGYCILYQAYGENFNEDLGNGVLTINVNDWIPMSSYTTFTAEEVGENNSLLIIAPSTADLHAAYKQPGSSPQYLISDISSDGGEEVRDAVWGELGSEEWNVFGVRKEDSLTNAPLIAKITYDNE